MSNGLESNSERKKLIHQLNFMTFRVQDWERHTRRKPQRGGALLLHVRVVLLRVIRTVSSWKSAELALRRLRQDPALCLTGSSGAGASVHSCALKSVTKAWRASTETCSQCPCFHFGFEKDCGKSGASPSCGKCSESASCWVDDLCTTWVEDLVDGSNPNSKASPSEET